MKMGDITSISLEETNKIRASLGLKLIPIPVNNVPIEHDKELHTLKKKVRPSHSETTTYDTHHTHVHERLRNRIQESKKHLNSSHGNREIEDIESIDDWLANVGKESTNKDNTLPPAVKSKNTFGVSENVTDIAIPNELKTLVDEKPLILTLKDTTENDTNGEDGYEDILENEKHSHDKQDAENLKLRQLNKNRRLGKVSLYDYEREENEDDVLREMESIAGTQSSSNKIRIESDSSDEDNVIQDYAPIKLKKRKKKSANQTKPRKIDNNKMMKVDLVNLDEDVTEEPPQILFKVKRKPQKAEENEVNIQQVNHHDNAKRMGIHILNNSKDGFIFDDTDEFLDSLKGDVLKRESETRPIKIDLKNPQRAQSEMTPETSTSEWKEGKEKELDFSEGVAGMISFLKEKNILKSQNGSAQQSGSKTVRSGVVNLEEAKTLRSIDTSSKELSSHLNSQAMDLSEEESRKVQLSNEENIASKLHRIQSEKLQNYNPNVELSYRDSEGNELTTKEAYKKLSQSWHGTKSNRKTIEKQRKKIAQRRNVMEKESLFDD